jgi:DNA repair protein RadC
VFNAAMAGARGKRTSQGVAGVEDAGAFFAPVEAAHSGHRERLRARFLKGGAEAMPDYELLELTLFAALPRRDTKPIAKALLARFGSFAEVIAAPRERLKEVEGVGDSVAAQLKIVEAAPTGWRKRG